MEYGFSILMFCFSGVLLLYAGLVAMGNAGLILRYRAARVKDKRKYTRQFGRILALVACAPALSGAVAMVGDMDRTVLPAMATLVLGTVVAITAGVKMMNRDDEQRGNRSAAENISGRL